MNTNNGILVIVLLTVVCILSVSCKYFNLYIREKNNKNVTQIKLEFVFFITSEAMLLTPWLVLFIDIVDNFDIRNILWKDLYIKDWKATSRYPKFRHIEIWDKRSKLSWRALSLKLDFRKISTWPKFRVNRVWHNEIQLYSFCTDIWEYIAICIKSWK